MSNVPDGAQLSDDGQWYWDADSNEWKAVEGGTGETGGGSAPGTSPSEGTGGDGQPSEEELRQVGDTGAEPGDEGKITEAIKPYFEPAAGDDDYSYADAGEAIDDSQFTGEGGESGETESEER